MAWEEESIDTGADFEEIGGKKNPIKMIIMGVVALLVIGGIVYGVMWFLNKDKGKEEEKEGKEGEVIAEGEEVDEPEVVTGFKVTLPEFTVNLADQGEPRYLQIEIALEVDKEELKTHLTEEADSMLYQVKARDTILQILRSKTTKEVNDAAASVEIAKEIKFKLNRMFKSGKVLNVYFTRFVTQ